MLSLVVVTAYMPSRNENAETGSMPKVKGSRIAMPVRPGQAGHGAEVDAEGDAEEQVADGGPLNRGDQSGDGAFKHQP